MSQAQELCVFMTAKLESRFLSDAHNYKALQLISLYNIITKSYSLLLMHLLLNTCYVHYGLQLSVEKSAVQPERF